MALPVVKSAFDCAQFTNTVEPYLQQLRPFPQVVFESITNASALKQIYLDTNPIITALSFSIALAPVALVVSESNKNYSQIDRLWSLLPNFYNLHYLLYAYLSGLDIARPGLVALATTIWSTRLTYNYWRRGGYQVGSEDYRWLIVKNYVGATVMFLFNIVFISLAQSLLLFMVTTPTYVILLTSRLATVRNESSADSGDATFAVIIAILVAFTATADEQQWNFQNAKHSYRGTAKVPAGYKQDELERGFPTTGLFAYSRKPNYAAEQCVWGTLYLWSCYASETWYNWTGFGITGYLFLFQASTWLTELLSEQKYPEYKQYRKQVGKFIPTSTKTPMFDKSPAKIANSPTSEEKEKDATEARKRYNLR